MLGEVSGISAIWRDGLNNKLGDSVAVGDSVNRCESQGWPGGLVGVSGLLGVAVAVVVGGAAVACATTRRTRTI